MRSKFTWIMTLLLALTINFSFAQEKVVSGTVVDDKAMPVPGANVVVRGTQRGVQTDFDGKYSISVNQGEVLEFSFVGFGTQSVTVGASNTVNVTLVEGEELKEVKLDVYRSATIRRSPVAVTTLSIEAIEDRANASVLQNLQGQVAGLNIATGSGQPGADSTIILRGVGTINGNVEPLFIVDGIPVDEDGFRTVNQNDIETIRILKDAAATSIYGNRGAAGVIVITTKRGRYDQPLQFRYTSQFGFSKLQPLNIDLMNSRELLNYERSHGQGGVGVGLTDAQINALSNQTNTYWADIFFREGTTKSHDLTMSSGSANSTNFTSLSYFEQDGIFRNTNLKRFTIRNNFGGKTTNDKFHYAVGLNIGFSKQNGIDGAGTNQLFFAPFGAALKSLPYLSPYDANGNITRDGGLAVGDTDALNVENIPYILLNSAQMNTDREDELKILASFNADYNFAKNLTAGIQMGGDFTGSTNREILHPESLLGPYQAQQGAQFGGLQQESTSRDFRFNTVTSLNYNNTFAEDHTVDFTVYTEYNKAHLDGINFNQFGLDPRLVGTGAAFIPGTTIAEELGPDSRPYIAQVNSTILEEGLFSYFANLDYDYKGKYGVSATVRRDASFRFIDENKWGTFWSVGGYWNVDEESFMDNSVFNQLKLRASYGTSGNQRILNAQYSGASLTRTLYDQGGSYNGNPSTVIGTDPVTGQLALANTSLQWEETAQTNIGIDFGVWNNKLTGSADWYRKLTTELFQNTPISPVNGTSVLSANVGAMENMGAELTLKYVVFDNEDWDISINANGSYNKNKIRELPASMNGISDASDSQALQEGEAIGSFYMTRYAGVNPANGNALFYTKEGGLTEQLVDADRVSTGKSIYPVWQGGFGSSIKFKGFEFNTQWSYFADLYRNNLDLADLEETNVAYDGFNRATSVTRAWQNPGDITDIPRVGNPLNSIDHINGSDRYIEDASFLRLRNVLVGYSFKKELLDQLPITGLRLFIQGENLVTFSSYRGWDAEGGFRTTDRGNYPTPKIYTFGAVVNF